MRSGKQRLKSAALRAESAFTAIPPVRWALVLPAVVLGRILWVWGRLRFAALVRDRGPGCVCHWQVDLKYPANIHLGEGVVIGVNASLGAHSSIRLGNRVRISREVMIETAGLDFASGAPPFPHVSKPIVIEDGAWIGQRAMVLGGVRIGAHAVVAAGSIVTRDVPARTVVGGIPARVIRSLPPVNQEPTA
ncbi:MAG: acyltransferase [Burkholderiales bacterium]|nr:acyltransferase [Burkholderiales bacterium]